MKTWKKINKLSKIKKFVMKIRILFKINNKDLIKKNKIYNFYGVSRIRIK